MEAATAKISGPRPDTTVILPGSICCAFNRIVAAANPITPGVVQPGTGTMRSLVPVAATTASALKFRVPFFPIDESLNPRKPQPLA